MKQYINGLWIPDQQGNSGEIGPPPSSEHYIKTESSAPSAFAEELHAKATYPYRGSVQYRCAIIAASIGLQKDRQRRKSYAYWCFDLSPGLLARIAAFLVGLGVILYVGYEAVRFARVLSDKCAVRSTQVLAD